MKTKDVEQADSILKSIRELENSIKNESVKVETTTDWHFGCGVEPHKLAMVHAKEAALSAAKSVMDCAAKQQIKILKSKLESMGVELE